MGQAQVGQRLPSVMLARAEGDALSTVALDRLLEGRRVLLVGLPGAFTPICTGVHIPELVSAAPQLKASGIQEIVCIAPNSPWVIHAWAQRTDPKRQLTFLSDGNLDLARAAGLVRKAHQLYLGECSARYTMIVDHAVVRKLLVEERLEDLMCTKPSTLI